MRVAIIIPTYNEERNIQALIETIFKIYPHSQIIVVDDNSPDGTAQKVLEMGKNYKSLHCLVRKENRGRGFAGVAGFKYALTLDVDCVMEMDGDFSHDPQYIPDFMQAMQSADVVIGSRFVKGGKDNYRGIIRKIVSFLANFYLRITLGVNVRDCTSGYRCFRKEVLQKMDLDSLKSCGPSILEEVLYRCRNYKIKEIPICFMERKYGYSKLNFKILVQCLLVPWKVRRYGKSSSKL